MNAQAQEVATVIDNDTGLVIPEEAVTAIAELQTVAAGLVEMQKKYKVVPDCSTPEGYELAKSEMEAIAQVRIDTGKAHKVAKAPYWDGGKRIDGMKNTILAVSDPLEDARKAAIKVVDDEQDRIAREIADKEQARIETIEAKVAQIKAIPSNAVTLEQAAAAIDALAAFRQDDSFDEFSEIAREEIEKADVIVSARHGALQAQADEAAAVAKQKVEQAEAQRKLDAQAADRKAEQDKRERDMDHREALMMNDEKGAEKADEVETVTMIDPEPYVHSATMSRVNPVVADDALQNDKDALRSWIEAIPETPEVLTDKGRVVSGELMDLIGRMNSAMEHFNE